MALPILSLLGGALLLFALGLPAAQPPPREPPRWWKGNLHTHSFWSDGDDFPESIVDWYKTNGYHFLALSDHNILQEGQRWLTVTNQGQESAFEKFRTTSRRSPSISTRQISANSSPRKAAAAWPRSSRATWTPCWSSAGARARPCSPTSIIRTSAGPSRRRT